MPFLLMKSFIGTLYFHKAEETSTQNEPAQTQKINLWLPKVAEGVEGYIRSLGVAYIH